ncbi:MAG: TlpA family protein disulfide reductase [Bacteroidales bacterium]
MYKTKVIFVTFVAICLSVLIASSFVHKDAQPGVGISPGSSFPDMTKLVKNAPENLLSNLNGEYVLIQFWAAYDAESRMKNVQLCNSLNQKNSNIKFLSVSMDPYKEISFETIRLDKIPNENVWIPNVDQREKLLTEFAPKGKLTNYLVSPEGVIIAKDISAKELAQMKI